MKIDKLIKYASEVEIDDGLKLGAFCQVHKFSGSPEDEEKERAYLAGQEAFILELQRRMKDAYGDKVFVSDNVWLSELLKIEVGSKEVSRKFFLEILRFLKECRCPSCAIVAVYEGSLGDSGQRYVGRVLICWRGITAEIPLEELFEDVLGGGKRSNKDSMASKPAGNHRPRER